MSYYTLYYKNIGICLFDSKDLEHMVFNNEALDYIPYGYTKKSIKEFIYNRGVPVTRDEVKRELGKVSSFEFMLLNKGLSLTDHYWIKKVEAKDTWESVNCFDNNFRDTYDLQLLKPNLDITEYSDFRPSASLKGDLKKKWLIDNSTGTRVLIKGNYGNSCLQSINEVFISHIHQLQNKFPYVAYRLIKIPTKVADVIGCCCANFVIQDTDFISAADVIHLHKNKCRSMHEMFNLFLEVCVKEGLDRDYVRKFLDYQIMIDFITTNTDRHLNNFGVLRDSNTLKFKCIAPIFDSGNSMGYILGSYIPVGRSALKIKEQVGIYEEYEVQVLKHVKNKGLVDLGKLPNVDYLKGLLDNDTEMSLEKKDRICRLYEAKVRFFSRFQAGEKIWLL